MLVSRELIDHATTKTGEGKANNLTDTLVAT